MHVMFSRSVTQVTQATRNMIVEVTGSWSNLIVLFLLVLLAAWFLMSDSKGCNEDREALEAEMEKRIEEVQRFKELFPEWKKKMREYKGALCNIADNIDTVHQGATIANITGSSMGAVGGILSIGGLIAAPFTMGSSLVLASLGAGIGVAGGVTNIAASGVDAFKQGDIAKQIDEIMKQYKEDSAEMADCCDQCVKTIQFLNPCLDGSNCTVEKIADTLTKRVMILIAAHKAASIAGRDAAKIAANKAVKEAARKSAKEAIRKAAKEAAGKAMRKAAKEAAGKAMRKAVKEAAGKAVSKVAKEAAGKAVSKVAKEAAGKAVSKAAKEAAGKAAGKSAGKAVARTMSKRALGTLGLSGLLVGWDIYSIVKDSLELAEGSGTQLSNQIRKLAQQMEDEVKIYEKLYNPLEGIAVNDAGWKQPN
ncbi:uncharacterized protein LOC121849701 [Callorhinchus milii]|uniref:uncharacterized protein LOC121849701 n=1 Tax=Callorhinchus milii TaxID=7868 RepID=UPI001C3FAB56|nr:uncharacterized protein LOC121849701 [Callorhinchus milii]